MSFSLKIQLYSRLEVRYFALLVHNDRFFLRFRRAWELIFLIQTCTCWKSYVYGEPAIHMEATTTTIISNNNNSYANGRDGKTKSFNIYLHTCVMNAAIVLYIYSAVNFIRLGPIRLDIACIVELHSIISIFSISICVLWL